MIVTVNIQIDFEKSDNETQKLIGRKAEQTLRGDGWDIVGEAISDAMVLIDTPRSLLTLAIVVQEYFDRFGTDSAFDCLMRDNTQRFRKAIIDMQSSAQTVVDSLKVMDVDLAKNGIPADCHHE